MVGRFSKTQSGVRVQELAIGSGLEATRGDSVEFDYVLRSASLHCSWFSQPLSQVPQLVYCHPCLQLYATLCTCKTAGAERKICWCSSVHQSTW